MPKFTPSRIRALKGKARFATVTVFDTSSARLADAAGLPLLLVGDSLGNTVLGFDSTLPVTLDHMLHHTAAAARGVRDALVVADMPFLTYQITEEEALRNAGRLMAEGSADAVKLEGGAERASTIRRLVGNGIPVVGHIGLTPQSVKQMGYTVQGRDPQRAAQLKEDAIALRNAGVFALVLEACPPSLAESITESLDIPTIGIGAGAGCDGQILVFHDLLGLNPGFAPPKFVKPYARIGEDIVQALKTYAGDVAAGRFPGEGQSYSES
jgi:3-methyl-2-oxobutanoate hydroxymethyltransferase